MLLPSIELRSTATVLILLGSVIACACGATDQLPLGGTNGTGACRIGDKTYRNGTSGIPAGDGCNVCECTNGTVSCTTIGCAPPTPKPTSTPTSMPTNPPSGPSMPPTPVPTGMPTPNPAPCGTAGAPPCADGSCLFNGVRYPDGATSIPEGDGCNYCSCQKGVLGCTQIDCGPLPPGCYVGGVWVPEGSTGLPSPDGCGSCSCVMGQLACSGQTCASSACVVNGVVYDSGASGVPDPSSCNSCSCLGGSVSACTGIHCPLPAPCYVGRAVYQDGYGFVSSDGTTRCVCKAGNMSCSGIP